MVQTRMAITLVACTCVLLAGMFQSGCGSIIHGSSQQISVTSDPPGARVTKLGKIVGVTPCNVTVSRAHPKTALLLSNEGLREKTVVLKSGVSPWALFGNLLFLPGYLVDLISGSFGEYPQESVAVDFGE